MVSLKQHELLALGFVSITSKICLNGGYGNQPEMHTPPFPKILKLLIVGGCLVIPIILHVLKNDEYGIWENNFGDRNEWFV